MNQPIEQKIEKLKNIFEKKGSSIIVSPDQHLKESFLELNLPLDIILVGKDFTKKDMGRIESEIIYYLKRYSEKKEKPIDFFICSFYEPIKLKDFKNKKWAKNIISNYSDGISNDFFNLPKPFNPFEFVIDSLLTWPMELEELIDELLTLSQLEDINKNPQIYVLIGKSGSGKNTLIDYTKKHIPNIEHAVKITTRLKRDYSVNENTQNISNSEFMKLNKENLLVGIVETYGNLYGYYRKQIENAIFNGKDILIETTNPKVALKMKKEFPGLVKNIKIESKEDVILNYLFKRQESIKIVRPYIDYTNKDLDKRVESIIKNKNNLNFEMVDFKIYSEFWQVIFLRN